MNKIKNFFTTKFKKKEKKEKVEKIKPIDPNKKPSKFSQFFSIPLLRQSIKSNWVLWLILTLGTVFIFVVINIAIGTKVIFSSINMSAVSRYANDENMSWLQILGLFNVMGLKLSMLETMSQIDLNTVMSDLIFKLAGVVLPMIYVMVVGNKLLASQVNDGSMAYVLSTPTARKKVVRTQFLFISVSLILMYILIFIGAYMTNAVCNSITNIMPPSTVALRTFLFCLASFSTIYLLMGFCFGVSAVFNKSSQSIALGGGGCVFAFICCILGLFSNPIFMAFGFGVQEMDIFNYMTVFTLINTDSLTAFAKGVTGVSGVEIDFIWLYEAIAGLIVGSGLAIGGGIYFTKKDLPL